jgi:ABC-2 type transport system ATP-binding protein
LFALAQQHEGTEVVDGATLILHDTNAHKMGTLLAALETELITVKKIRYGTTNLESLFLRLTSHGSHDV